MRQSKLTAKFRIENCYLSSRDLEIIFDFRKNAKRIVNLDGYAIVPLEEFAGHAKNAAEAAALYARSQNTPDSQERG